MDSRLAFTIISAVFLFSSFCMAKPGRSYCYQLISPLNAVRELKEQNVLESVPTPQNLRVYLANREILKHTDEKTVFTVSKSL